MVDVGARIRAVRMCALRFAKNGRLRTGRTGFGSGILIGRFLLTEGEAMHYMYVVKCADGTLYTGYSPDVGARVAAHNAGKGAKYTKTRLPVELVASAAFATKHEAMSAEWHFKRLTRAQKEDLLGRVAAGEPFEDVLAGIFDLKLSEEEEEPPTPSPGSPSA